MAEVVLKPVAALISGMMTLIASSPNMIADIDPEVKFMGLRHGGNTEGADADLTDAQLRALSGHTTPTMTILYARQTMKQRREGARKRLAARSKK
jgi:hypothetical protein